MFRFIHHLLGGSGSLASGSLLVMLFGAAGLSLRAIPLHLWQWLVDQATMSLTVTDDDASFHWIKEWFHEQRFLRRMRRVGLDTTMRGAEVALIPAPGVHLFWRAGRPFWLDFHRSDDTRGRSQRRAESLTFQTLGRNQALLRQFVDEIVAAHHRRQRVRSSLFLWDDFWSEVQAYSPRLLDSIILPPGDKEALLQDIARFRASGERYRQLGVPYHRGYLLFGPPGTGKTSLVSAVAAHFGLSIYLLNLAELNDRTLKNAINEVPGHSIILCEDIDAMRVSRSRSGQDASDDGKDDPNRSGVTLSGLLNVLDGFHAPDNVLFAMTTNHAESLDPALLRPGRIDYRLYLGSASHTQKVELYRRFFPAAPTSSAEAFAAAQAFQTMAEYQGELLRLEQQEADSSPRQHVYDCRTSAVAREESEGSPPSCGEPLGPLRDSRSLQRSRKAYDGSG